MSDVRHRGKNVPSTTSSSSSSPASGGSDCGKSSSSSPGLGSVGFIKLFLSTTATLLAVSAVVSFTLDARLQGAPPGEVTTVGFFGQDLHVVCRGGEKGKGPLAIVFHGSGLDSTASHLTFLSTIYKRNGVRACAVDRPGHGWSSFFEASSDEYSGRRISNHVSEVIQALIAVGEAEYENPSAEGKSPIRAVGGHAVTAIGFDTGAYEALLLHEFTAISARKRPIIIDPDSVVIDALTGVKAENFIAKAANIQERKSLYDILSIASLTGVLRWTRVTGHHPFKSFIMRLKNYVQRSEIPEYKSNIVTFADMLTAKKTFAAASMDMDTIIDVRQEAKKLISERFSREKLSSVPIVALSAHVLRGLSITIENSKQLMADEWPQLDIPYAIAELVSTESK